MMKNTLCHVLLSLTLANTAFAERHSLRLRGVDKSGGEHVNAIRASQALSLSSEQELVDAAIQEAMLYEEEEELLELVETLEARKAGIEKTAPHDLNAIESANEYLETRGRGISKTRPHLSEDSADDLFDKRAEGIEATSPHDETANEAIQSANFYLESRAEGIAKTRPLSSDEGKEMGRPSLRASKNTETAMA